MYNNERKQRYIEEKTQQTILNPYFLPNMFNKISVVEEEKGKDIADFSTYDILECYKRLNTTSLEFLRNLNSQLSTYTQWCMQQNLVMDNQNHYFEIKDQMLKDSLNKFLFNIKFVTRETIVDWANQLLNAQDSFILLALFEYGRGQQWKDILQVKLEDVSKDSIKLPTGRTVRISPELRQYAIKAAEETIYNKYKTNGEFHEVNLLPSEYIVKDKYNAMYTDNKHRARVMIYNTERIYNYLGISDYMTNGGIIESGKLHMVRERAAHYGITPKEYIYSDYKKEIEEQYNCVITRPRFMTKYGDLL